MAEKKRSQTTKASSRRPSSPSRKSAGQRRKPAGREMTLESLFKRRKNKDLAEFKPDSTTATWAKTMRMTRQQQLRLTKWALYILTIVLSLVLQDVMMSQFSLFGATTDLAVGTILLITVMEGTEIGSLFVLTASTLYYFAGTAPGAYCIGLMTFLGIGATLFRQLYWHRSKGSVILCTAAAVTLYEMGLFVVGLMSELTRFSRIGIFALTAALSCAALIPLYALIYRIGMIGGNTWKE